MKPLKIAANHYVEDEKMLKEIGDRKSIFVNNCQNSVSQQREQSVKTEGRKGVRADRMERRTLIGCRYSILAALRQI